MLLGLWQDRPPAEVLHTAQVADELGYGEIWIGEMATFDAFALGAVVAERTARATLTVGPLAVAVRDPVMIAMGVGSLTELTGRAVNVALGPSSPSGWNCATNCRATRWARSSNGNCAPSWPVPSPQGSAGTAGARPGSGCGRRSRSA